MAQSSAALNISFSPMNRHRLPHRWHRRVGTRSFGACGDETGLRAFRPSEAGLLSIEESSQLRQDATLEGIEHGATENTQDQQRHDQRERLMQGHQDAIDRRE